MMMRSLEIQTKKQSDQTAKRRDKSLNRDDFLSSQQHLIIQSPPNTSTKIKSKSLWHPETPPDENNPNGTSATFRPTRHCPETRGRPHSLKNSQTQTAVNRSFQNRTE